MKLCLIIALCCCIAFAQSFDASMSACKIQQRIVEQQNDLNAFYPRCDGNGNYAAIQCRQGFCWCANKQGFQLTKSKPGYPDCSQYRG